MKTSRALSASWAPRWAMPGSISPTSILAGRPNNGHALALVEIDEPCSEAVADEIAAIDGVIQTKVMRF